MSPRAKPEASSSTTDASGLAPWIGAATLAALFSIGALANAQTVTLTPQEMKAQAMAAATAGQHRMALALLEALLHRDPKDFGAWLLSSRLWRDQGRTDLALTAARRASELADTDAEKFQSSLLVAQALATAERRTEAQLWLRWAAEQAPNEQARAVAMRDFRYVQSRNPLSIELTFDIAPTSNVNNGSSQDVVTLFGLPFALSGAAQALSGTRIAGGTELTWRLDASETRQSHLSLALFHQTYVLSDDAKARAPGTTGSDFAYTSAALTYQQQLSLGEGRGLWGWSLGAGRNWYGGTPLADYVSAGIDRTFRVGRADTLTLGAAVEYQDRLDGSNAWANAVEVTASYIHKTPARNQLRLDFGVEDSTSNDPSLDYTAWSVAAQYRLGKPVMNGVVTLVGGLEWRDFPVSPYTTTGREDLSARLGAEFLFYKVDYWGFAPVLTIEQNTRASDVDLYDSDTLSVKLGVRSVF